MSERRNHYLVAGCTPPDDAALDRFWDRAKTELGSGELPDAYLVRWIGGNAATTAAILDHIRSGEKTGTVSLPWVARGRGQPPSRVGDAIILIDFDGTPALLVRISAIEEVPYGSITEAHTALDGPKVRPLEIWKPVHVGYFNKLLAPHQLSVTDDMPVWFEKFELLFP